MKLNFWQILGVIVILVGLILLIRREMSGTASPTPAPTPAPTISPAVTIPATTPA